MIFVISSYVIIEVIRVCYLYGTLLIISSINDNSSWLVRCIRCNNTCVNAVNSDALDVNLLYCTTNNTCYNKITITSI